MITDRDVILSVSEGSPQLAAVCTLFMRFFALRAQNDNELPPPLLYCSVFIISIFILLLFICVRFSDVGFSDNGFSATGFSNGGGGMRFFALRARNDNVLL